MSYVEIHVRLACGVRAKPKHSVYHTHIYFDVTFGHVSGCASEDTEDKLGGQCQTIIHYSDGSYPGQTSTTPVSIFRATPTAELRNRVAVMARRPEHRSALQCEHCKVDGKRHENHGDGERNEWGEDKRCLATTRGVASEEGEKHKGNGE